MTLNCRLVLDGHSSLIILELSVISLAVSGAMGCWVNSVVFDAPMKDGDIYTCSIDIVLNDSLILYVRFD
jgi:hypothetical protein